MKVFVCSVKGCTKTGTTSHFSKSVLLECASIYDVEDVVKVMLWCLGIPAPISITNVRDVTDCVFRGASPFKFRFRQDVKLALTTGFQSFQVDVKKGSNIMLSIVDSIHPSSAFRLYECSVPIQIVKE